MKNKKPFLEILNKENNIKTKSYIMALFIVIIATIAFAIFIPFNILSNTSPMMFSLCVGTILVGVMAAVILIYIISERIKKEYFNTIKNK